MLTLAEDTHEHQSAYTSTRVGPLATPASKLSSLSSTTRPSGRSVAIAGAARHTSASVRSVARMAGARATKSVTRGRDSSSNMDAAAGEGWFSRSAARERRRSGRWRVAPAHTKARHAPVAEERAPTDRRGPAIRASTSLHTRRHQYPHSATRTRAAKQIRVSRSRLRRVAASDLLRDPTSTPPRWPIPPPPPPGSPSRPPWAPSSS